MTQRRATTGIAAATIDEPAPPSGTVDSKASQTVATVERAADVLLHFADTGRRTLGVTDIATDLGLSKAVVHRLLTSLRSRGLIAFDPHTRRYSLGPATLRLGLACLEHLDVRRIANGELVALSARTNETTTLSVRQGDTRLYVEQVTPAREIFMSVTMGVPFPLHAGASSKAFLAFLDDAEVDAYLSRTLAKVTPSTVTDVATLRVELDQIRAQGWARSLGERQSGACSVAAPVFDHSHRAVAVVSICGPAERFAGEVDACITPLLESTARISAQLGGSRPDRAR